MITRKVLQNLFNLALVTPLSLTKNKSGYGSIRLLSSISQNKPKTEVNDKKSTPTSTENLDSNTENNDNKLTSLFKNIIHGSPEIREEEKQTHSKIIARGKYVHELQKHKIKPDCVEDYIKLVSEHYPRIANYPKNSVHLCGSWQTEIGDLDSFFHIWEYQGYTGYHETLNRLKNDQHYQRFDKELRPMLQNRHNQICLEFAFWATSPPTVHGGIYELRTYELKTGKLLEWETHWKGGLECRRQYCEPVGAWFSQLGALNFVHHMWQYPDLESRKLTRERAWEVDGWAETVFKTVPLIHKMDTCILIPLPFSPLR
ncbi:hypothetical protein C1645_766242 [Glomus cerebriforme]|uniref:NIPSNAP domain-containing protein n=1 Tax=Glomus cerebriforme TaxID=658196 RepID=A0A397T6K5_9GLOM|nr:hypothetical protein C1645_766242 [Glomus cerebriforme]